MRFERHSAPSKLTPRLERFFVEALGGESLDALQHAEVRKIDYRCFRGLLAIELKSLEEDGSERMNNVVDDLRERSDWPTLLGSAPLQSFLDQLDKPEDIKRQLVERLGRAIKSHIRKANKQLDAHTQAFPRRSVVRLVVLANEDHELYAPDMVGFVAQHLLRRHVDGISLYPNIDAIVFLSERHATSLHHKPAFPILNIEGKSMDNAPWKRDVINLVLSRWAHWNGAPLEKLDRSPSEFTTIDAIPRNMKRHEMRELDYRRNPYMQGFSDAELRARFDEVSCISALLFIRSSPLKPSKDATSWSHSSMSHLMIEMGQRGIPVTKFTYEPRRLAAAAKRMGLPTHVVTWFATDMGRSRS